MDSRGLALRQGTLRIPSAAIATDVRVEPADIELTGLRLSAFGGEFSGSATLRDLARYQVAGRLRNLDIQALAQLAGEQLPYSGTISGPLSASGDLEVPGDRSLQAKANLSIAAGGHGIPLQGRVQGL